MRPTMETAEVKTILADKFVYNKNKFAIKNTMPE